MKQFATILFVLIFSLAGNSRAQDLSQNKIGCNSFLFINENQICQNPTICEDLYFDGQDTNDLDGFDAVSVLPDPNHIFQHPATTRVAAVFSFYRYRELSELLLDLPPPSFSV